VTETTPQAKGLKASLKKIPLLVSIHRALWKLYPQNALKQLTNFRTLSKSYGQLASMKRWSCVDGQGNPIPWYTYPAIEYLSHFDFSARKVFEYGSGNSSLWWASRCKSLVSIENDKVWYDKIKQGSAALTNFDYRFEDDKLKYARQDKISDSDIVIIDGFYRPECADYFLEQNKLGHIDPVLLIFDNSDWFPKAIARLHKELNWVQVDFSGFGPINQYTWTTTIFINPLHKNKLAYSRALSPISGIPQVDKSDY
jgi:hypothetical protein